uniref:Zinc finger and AT hook domain containing n=1 Tax=Echeneis naucrates TaxID=173247 RepID=A0A665TG46_ECHNA
MKEQETADTIFMCRLCNLFSPSCSQLLAHCSQLHPQQDPPDDIITALQPLVPEPVETLAETPVKRKRGRPKGSTKKTRTDLTNCKVDSIHSQEDGFQRQEEENQKEGDQQCSSSEGDIHNGFSRFECRKCHRSFRNRRQILKHICLREEEEEAEEDNGNTPVGAEVEGSETLDPAKADPNQMQQNPVQPGFVREKDGGSFRSQRTNRSRVSKEVCPAKSQKGSKKSVISVVLTEDETLPGVSQMVPVEDGLAESKAIKAQSESAVFQTQSQDLTTEATICENNPKVDLEPSSNTTSTTTAVSRGFQEYSIKQDAANLPQSQLKIFACEFCNKIFKFRHSLIAHLRTHTQEKPFKCPHCDYASAIKANLNVHLRKHTGEKFSCQHCPFNCLSPGHLKVHIERVHLKVKQHCSFCDKKYSDVKNLIKHIEKRHNLKDPAVYQSYQQLKLKTRQGLRQLLYHCPTCNRRFKNQLERERHLLVHGTQHPFACQLCDHTATRMDALSAHVRKHLFLYMCCLCDKKFVSSQRLKSHVKESHPDVDQDQAFTDCINNSYYLAGGGMGRNEEGGRNGVEGEEWPHGGVEQLKVAASKDKEEARAQDESTEIGGVVQGPQNDISIETTSSTHKQDKVTAGELTQADTANLSTPALHIDTHEKDTQTFMSPESSHSPVPEDSTQDNKCTASNTHTTSSSGDLDVNTPSSSALSGEEGQTLHSEKESEVFHQSAFQQVLISLQKTQLNMETYQRLRKIYGDLECQYCGKLFWYKVHYSVHVRTHTKEHSHYCTKCSYSSITKSSLKRHQIQKHSGLLLPCSNPGCKYTTPDKYKLQAHQKTHQEQRKSVACPVCQQSCPEHRLKHHIKTSHPDALSVQGKGLMVQRAEKCPYCDSYFLKSSSDFQQHIWAHQGLKPYVCSVCDYAGRSKSYLKVHMNRHDIEKRHLCDLCGKKFKSKFTLKSHRLSHTNEGKRFQCSECDFTSVSKPSLLRHKEQHAEFKPFRCAHCHYSCNIAGPLKRHYKLKHPNETYENAGPGLPNPESLKQKGGMKCPECEFVYGTKWELNRHLKSKHSLKVVEGTWEVSEEVEAQYVSVEDEEQLTEAHVAALNDNVNIQQITEFSSETHNAVTSMVAMAPGTVTVVQQLQVADEQEVGNCSNQLMVVNTEGGLSGDQVMVVEDAHGLEALTVLTQEENTHHYIVYVQEHTVEIN